jgi:hypothetical protein
MSPREACERDVTDIAWYCERQHVKSKTSLVKRTSSLNEEEPTRNDVDSSPSRLLSDSFEASQLKPYRNE